MKKFLAVVTSMAMAASLLTACGSNAASTETTTAAASEAASEKETAGKEAEETEPGAKTDGAASAQFQSSILFCGSTSLYPILSSLASSFTEKYVTWDAVDSSFPDSNISVYVAPGGSGVGVQQVGEGLVQIGNTGRPLKDKEIEKFGLKTFPFAIDGVALVVNPANNVSDITAQQAADIYNGKITNWKELGGTDAPITLYTREDGSGTREVFTDKAIKKGSVAAKANVVNSNGAMKTAVAQDKQSIGYVGIGHVDKNVKALVFDKMVPSQENASNGTYKVTRLLFMNTKGAPEDITKAFIDYIYTPEGTEIIKKSGYIPTGRQ